MVWRREKLDYQGKHYTLPLDKEHGGSGLGKSLKIINHPVRENIHEVHVPPVFVFRLRQNILHPEVRLPADVQKQVAVRYRHNVLHTRIKAVQVHSALHQPCHLGFLRPVSKDIPHPVIFRKDRGYDPERLRFCKSSLGGRYNRQGKRRGNPCKSVKF